MEYKPNNKVLQIIYKITPIIICWELWKARCASTYRGINISVARIHFQVLSHLRWVIYKHNIHIEGTTPWHEIYDMLMSLTAKIICIQVKWEKPSFGWAKLNTDGSKKGNELIGVGGILRDHKGDMIMTFSQKLGCGMINLAEAKAALIGFQWCHSNGYDRVILECNFKLVVDMLNNSITPAWHIDDTIREAQLPIHQHDIVIRYCYRAANNVADVLEKMES